MMSCDMRTSWTGKKQAFKLAVEFQTHCFCSEDMFNKRRQEVKERLAKRRYPRTLTESATTKTSSIIMIITDNFCIALVSGVPKLTALYKILQHFLSFTNIIHIIMTSNNV